MKLQVVKNGDTTEAKTFGGLVAQLQQANTAGQYGMLANVFQ